MKNFQNKLYLHFFQLSTIGGHAGFYDCKISYKYNYNIYRNQEAYAISSLLDNNMNQTVYALVVFNFLNDFILLRKSNGRFLLAS